MFRMHLTQQANASKGYGIRWMGDEEGVMPLPSWASEINLLNPQKELENTSIHQCTLSGKAQRCATYFFG